MAEIGDSLSMDAVTDLPITIRPAYPDDASALLRLADLDSSAVPSEPLIVAEVDGEIQVAVSMSDLGAIADPFVPTAHIVDLVRGHIRQSVRPPASRRRLLSRLSPAFSPRVA
jgi:hypothetical protein